MMKKYPKYLIILCSILWLGLFFDRILLLQSPDTIVQFVASIVYIPHLLTIFLTYKIYKNASHENKNLIFWFLLTNIGLLFNDVSWYFVAYYKFDIIHIFLKPFLINLIAFFSWNIVIIIFLAKILNRYILQMKPRLKMLIMLGLINVAIILLFLSSIHYTLGIYSLSTVSQISTFISQIIVFDFVILCLISTENRGLILFLTGIIILISGDFFIIYSTISQTSTLYSYGTLLWLLGLLFNLFGVLIINRNNDYVIKNWVRNDNTIKSKLVFWSFSMATISFLLFFIMAYTFSIISNIVFLGLPLFIMIYSIIVIMLSIYMGKHFEIPFKQIAGNIKMLMLDESQRSRLFTNFSIEEFVFLQKFIIDAFTYKEMHKKFGVMAAEVAHDLGSPLNAMNVAIASLKQANIACDDVALLERAMQSVKNITGSLLTRYRNLDNNVQENSLTGDDGNIPRYIVLSTLLENIIANKRVEWSINPCNISYNVGIDTPVWLYVAPIQLSRVISNLLNNSYESMNKETREINISLSVESNKFNLLITDNGCGILPEQVSKVLLGKSLKHSGNGIGLSGAKRYFESLGGALSLTSIYGEGTEIKISIPLASQPTWFNNEIAYNNQTIFVVLDDDPSIIMLWQRIFMKLNIKCQYFTNPSEFKSWYLINKSENIVLLVDYDLQNGIYGIDVIKECSPINAYLITSHAEEVWLQDLVTELAIKLIPKSLIGTIKFTQVANL